MGKVFYYIMGTVAAIALAIYYWIRKIKRDIFDSKK